MNFLFAVLPRSASPSGSLRRNANEALCHQSPAVKRGSLLSLSSPLPRQEEEGRAVSGERGQLSPEGPRAGAEAIGREGTGALSRWGACSRWPSVLAPPPLPCPAPPPPALPPPPPGHLPPLRQVAATHAQPSGETHRPPMSGILNKELPVPPRSVRPDLRIINVSPLHTHRPRLFCVITSASGLFSLSLGFRPPSIHHVFMEPRAGTGVLARSAS